MQVSESKKSFDATISKIADNIKSELHLNDLLFIAIMNPETQCLHYIGRSYYREIISSYKPKEIEAAVRSAQSNIARLGPWYNHIKTEGTDTADDFIDLLFNTPISRYYRLSGRVYNAGSPVFFYTKNQFELYKGKHRYIKHDPILDKKQDAFGDIIDELEKVFFKKLDVLSGMMTPIYLYGQIIGAVFLGDKSEKKFNYYDYLRLLQIIKESAITLIKDAMEFEFLSAVLKDMLVSGLLSAILSNLPKLFCISGACMKDANGNCSQLIFKKNDAELIPKWAILPCDHNSITSCAFAKCPDCNNGEKHEHSNIISDICDNYKGSLLDLKSGMHIVNKGLKIITYFSSEYDVLEIHKRGIALAFDDALELLFVEEQVKQEITKHALKAAISAIMSRNMSHNIGSHVLSKVSIKDPDETKWKEWGKDMQILSQYLQQRQDFIAQIATEWPEWTYPAWLMKDLMRWFLSQKHLLNYIGSSENLCAHFYKDSNPDSKSNFPIRFHVLRSCKKIWDKNIWGNGARNEMGVELWKTKIEEHCRDRACSTDGCAVKGSCSTWDASKLILLFTSKEHTCCCPDEDIQVAIPGGIIGHHAFYTIIENVIRNGAKHSFTRMKDDKTDEDRLSLAFGQKANGKRDKHFDVIIEFLDAKHKDNNSYRFRVYDNVSFVTEEDISELGNCLYYPNLDGDQAGIKFNPLKQEDYDELEDLWKAIDALRDKNGEEVKFDGLSAVIKNGASEEDKNAQELSDRFSYLTGESEVLKKRELISNGTNLEDETVLKELHATLKALYEHLLGRMNNYFRQDIITKSGELKKGNWGLGEMKISAGYLQQKEIMHIGMGGDKVTDDQKEKTGSSKDESFIIRATVSPLGTLAYEFRIPKPKEVGILCEVKSD